MISRRRKKLDEARAPEEKSKARGANTGIRQLKRISLRLLSLWLLLFSLAPVFCAQEATGGSSRASNSAALEKRYSLTLTLRAQNLFNRTNASLTVGNLSSPLFGQAVSSAGSFGFGGVNPSAGNRRLEAQVRFTF